MLQVNRFSTSSHVVMASVFILVILFEYVHGLYTRPTWVTSDLVRAGNNAVIKTRTAFNETPTYDFTFSSSLSGTPYLGYGIKAYQGNDYLGQEYFEINRTSLNQSSFSVAVQISGNTIILLLNVPYIAIDPTFPHHLNSFDNVPVNYSAGPLVNITQNTTTTNYYTNIINYTQQAAGMTYTTFQEPLSRNKVLLFLTSLFIRGTMENTSIDNPINFTVNSQVYSTSQYKIQVSLSTKSYITKLHFSMVIFDETDAMYQKNYMLVYQRIDLPYTGGFVPVPVEFTDNFIMGMLYFSTNRSRAIIDFQWDFKYDNGVHGVYMPLSIGQAYLGVGNQTINRVTFTLLYLKTWNCTNLTFFDPNLDLCSSCPILNCKVCLNLTACSLCDQSNHYYLNKTTMSCQQIIIITDTTDYLKMTMTSCNKFQLIFRANSINFISKLYEAYFNNTGLTIVERLVKDETVTILGEYNRDIDNETIELLIPSSSFRLGVSSDSGGIPLLKYQENQCQTYEFLKQIQLAIQILSYIALLISLLSCKIVGLELFGVLQLAYFSLAQHNFLNIYLSPLISFKIFNGLNLPFFSEPSFLLPPNIQVMEVSASFINNCNIMIILLFIELLVSMILYLVSKITHSDRLLNISQRMFKEGFITLVMFNIFNITFSAGIHWKYYIGGDSSAVWSSFLLYLTLFVIILSILCLQFLSEEKYGQFKLKFKENFVCRSYILVSLLYRMSLGFCMALKNDYDEAPLILLGISMTFVLYNLINLPFSDYMQNYRCNLIHITQLVTILCANYYRSMKLNTPIQIKGRLFSFSILQIVMIVLCIIFSMIMGLNQLIKAMKKSCRNKSIQDNFTSMVTTEELSG